MTKPIQPRYSNAADMVRADSHFTIERWGKGFAVTVKRRGSPPETILCDTPAEANRLRLRLSSEGLRGWHVGGAS